MDSIRYLYALFQQKTPCLFRPRKIQRPDALENSILAMLPTEIMQNIATHLPIASAAMFTLSCRQIYLLLGTSYLEKLALEDEQKAAFLNLLEHDLPNQIACNSCKKLHKIENAKRYSRNHSFLWPRAWRKEAPSCMRNDRSMTIRLYTHPNFSTTIFNMVMKHYQHFGYDAQTHRLLKYLSESLSSELIGPKYIKRRVICDIRNGSLFSYDRVSLRWRCNKVGQTRCIRFYICAHLQCISGEEQSAGFSIRTLDHSSPEEKWSAFIPCTSDSSGKSTLKNTSSELQQCRYCRTEYKADFEHNDSCETVLTVSIWKDLGQGTETEEWNAHLYRTDWKSYPLATELQRGDIASVFKKGYLELGS